MHSFYLAISISLFAISGCTQSVNSENGVPLAQSVENGYSILFTKQKNRTDNLYLLLKDGKERAITNHPRKDSSPVLSPDGKEIVFTSERVGWWKIWLMDIQKNTFRQLTDSSSAEYAPVWSISGNEILFVSERDGDAEIYIMRKDGSNMRNLTSNPASDSTPFWAADEKIYYSTEIEGVHQIARMNPDGTSKEILSTGKGDKLMPQLSPDKTRVLFYGDATGNHEIYVLKLGEEFKPKRLTDDPLMDIRPRWSPDGRQIVFERGDKKQNQHIFLMDSDGNNQTQLTFKDYNYSPSFVSNETYLAKAGE